MEMVSWGRRFGGCHGPRALLGCPMPELVRPSAQYQASCLEAVREAQATGSGLGDTLTWNLGDISADFDRVLRDLTRFEPPNELPDGFVHSEYR